MDLDDLLDKNRYGGDDRKATLSSLMASNRCVLLLNRFSKNLRGPRGEGVQDRL